MACTGPTQRFGCQYPTWQESPESLRVEGCETLAEVQQRAVRSAELFRLRDCGRQVLLVTHLIVAHFRSFTVASGGVIRL